MSTPETPDESIRPHSLVIEGQALQDMGDATYGRLRRALDNLGLTVLEISHATDAERIDAIAHHATEQAESPVPHVLADDQSLKAVAEAHGFVPNIPSMLLNKFRRIGSHYPETPEGLRASRSMAARAPLFFYPESLLTPDVISRTREQGMRLYEGMHAHSGSVVRSREITRLQASGRLDLTSLAVLAGTRAFTEIGGLSTRSRDFLRIVFRENNFGEVEIASK